MASIHLTTARNLRALHPGQDTNLTVRGVEYRVRCWKTAGDGRRRLTLYRQDRVLGEFSTNSGCARRITGGRR